MSYKWKHPIPISPDEVYSRGGFSMQLDVFDYYLIAINSLGIILYLINWWLYSHTERAQIDILLTICCLAGGSLGIIIAILCVDRKPGHGRIMV